MIQKIIDKLLSLISLKTPISNGDTGEIKAILYPVIKRIRLFQLLRGLIITLSVALASVITIMVIDALVVIYSTSLRTLISVFGLIITLSALYLFLIKVLIDPISPLRISRIIENRHPEIQERISSALELMENGENGNILASKQLLSLLKQDALQDLGSISINEEFKSSNLKKNIILASVFAVVLLLSFSICPKETALLFARAVAPTCKLNNLYAHNFNIEPKDKIIIEGDSITFTLTTPRTESPRADFIIENKGKPVSVERMKKVFSLDETESTTFQLLRPSIKESFNYRIRLGKALTRTYTITTLPPPCVSSMDITLLPPEYTGMAPALITTNESVEISMPYGTKATLNATFNRPMESMLNLGDNLTLRPLIAGAKSSASFNWTLSTNNASHWSISLKDGRGFTSQTEQGNYEVIPDYPPQVQLTYPSGSSYVLPTYGHLKTIYKLYDDHGISEVTLNILPDNERIPWTKELTFTNLTEKTYQASEDISLGEFFFSNARNIKIWLEISDNLPAYLGGPNKVHSRTIAVNLNNNEKRSILDQVRIPERDAITSAVKKTSEELKASAEKLEKIKATPNTPQSEKVLQELEEKISSIQEKIEEANTLAEKGVFKALVDELGDLVEDDLQDAINKIEAIPLTPEEEAQKAIEEAIEAMNKAAIEAEKILPEVEATDKLLENASKLDELSRAESAIAEEAAKRTLTNEELRKMQQQQTELMAKIEELKTKHPAEEDARLPDSSYEKLNSFNPSETSQKAIEALEKAKERPKDEQELLVVREIEKAALEIQTAIDKEKVATDLEAKIEQDRAALDQIEKEAKEKKKEAAILKDEAKDVQLEKTKEILVRPGHDEKLAQEILHDSANLLKDRKSVV